MSKINPQLKANSTPPKVDSGDKRVDDVKSKKPVSAAGGGECTFTLIPEVLIGVELPSFESAATNLKTALAVKLRHRILPWFGLTYGLRANLRASAQSKPSRIEHLTPDQVREQYPLMFLEQVDDGNLIRGEVLTYFEKAYSAQVSLGLEFQPYEGLFASISGSIGPDWTHTKEYRYAVINRGMVLNDASISGDGMSLQWIPINDYRNLQYETETKGREDTAVCKSALSLAWRVALGLTYRPSKNLHLGFELATGSDQFEALAVIGMPVDL